MWAVRGSEEWDRGRWVKESQGRDQETEEP